MPLEEYEKKRRFSATPEPKPDTRTQPDKKTAKPFFCVQRHDATNLHYDFRLEIDGVLVSWAVPKGPSLDPARKALAMKVEDHPFDYGEFEGNIPAGNYGAGSVMLWDRGTFEVLTDTPVNEQLARGDLKFELSGRKLKGSFAIVRMKKAQKGNEWLLIKKPDEHAVKDWNIEELAWSVSTKRTQAEIAGNETVQGPGELDGAKKTKMPEHLEPMLAGLAKDPPKGAHWWYEIKWDGVRAICFIDNGKLRIETRNRNRCDQQYPELANLPKQLQAKTAILDGEIAVLDEEGRSRFELIQPRITTNTRAVPALMKSNPVTLFLFDISYADGYDLRGVALENRKELLKRLVTPEEPIRISEHFEAAAEDVLDAARRMQLEGVIAKDRRSQYEGKRTSKWLKLKVINEDEFVIAGFTEGEREHFGALILAAYNGGKLRHVGQCGTGFDQKAMRALMKRFEPLVTDKCPITPKPKLKGATWLKPELVCQARFQEQTSDGMLRQAVYMGLRNDKPAEEVIQEEASEPIENNTDFPLTGKEAVLELNGNTVKLTNLGKVYFPSDGFTKRDLLNFYHEVSPWLLPHLESRPLSLKRYPNGIHDKYFFHKNMVDNVPEWLQREPIQEEEDGKTIHYAVANDEASLLYLVNLGCIDHNPFISRIGSLDHPDWALIDLDPVECPYDMIVEAALVVRRILKKIGLEGYAKTTGGDGMHIYIPLEPRYSFDQVRSFAELLSQLAESEASSLFTTPRSVQKRKKGRVYFDWQQIGSGKTIAAPYVVRAHDGAPVATPLDWKEVKKGLDPRQFTMKNVVARFERLGDIFRPVLEGGQRIEPALAKIQELSAD